MNTTSTTNSSATRDYFGIREAISKRAPATAENTQVSNLSTQYEAFCSWLDGVLTSNNNTSTQANITNTLRAIAFMKIQNPKTDISNITVDGISKKNNQWPTAFTNFIDALTQLPQDDGIKAKIQRDVLNTLAEQICSNLFNPDGTLDTNKYQEAKASISQLPSQPAKQQNAQNRDISFINDVITADTLALLPTEIQSAFKAHFEKTIAPLIEHNLGLALEHNPHREQALNIIEKLAEENPATPEAFKDQNARRHAITTIVNQAYSNPNIHNKAQYIQDELKTRNIAVYKSDLAMAKAHLANIKTDKPEHRQEGLTEFLKSNMSWLALGIPFVMPLIEGLVSWIPFIGQPLASLLKNNSAQVTQAALSTVTNNILQRSQKVAETENTRTDRGQSAKKATQLPI